jgi:hypothetical protein
MSTANPWILISRFFALRPDAGLGFLIREVSRSHTTKQHSWWDSSGRVISSSQRTLPDNRQQLQEKDFHVPAGIRTHILSKQVTAYLCLRPRGQWDQLTKILVLEISFITLEDKINN